MAEDIKRLATNVSLLSETRSTRNRQQSQATHGMKKQYFAQELQDYAESVSEYATNAYDGVCEGLNPSDFYEKKKILLRSSSASGGTTGENIPDDWQRIHIVKPKGITYVPQGAYLEYAGSKWIVFKSRLMGAVLGHAIVRRCNTVLNSLDWYGNIVSTPMSFAKISTQGNANQVTENIILAKNYVQCLCQLNDTTKQFTEGTRFVLGSTAYAMRGLNDFTREFTDDPDSIHLLTFTIERQEILKQDSVEKQCADYNSFAWKINPVFKSKMVVGSTQAITVESVRNGSTVTSSTEHPISYRFASLDTSVATVTSSGVITAVSQGNATVRIFLEQNENVYTDVSITVQTAISQSYVEFLDSVERIKEYKSATISAALIVNGIASSDTLAFTFSDAIDGSYSATPANTANTYSIYCYASSQKPLKVTATDGNGHSAEMYIKLGV